MKDNGRISAAQALAALKELGRTLGRDDLVIPHYNGGAGGRADELWIVKPPISIDYQATRDAGELMICGSDGVVRGIVAVVKGEQNLDNPDVLRRWIRRWAGPLVENEARYQAARAERIAAILSDLWAQRRAGEQSEAA